MRGIQPVGPMWLQQGLNHHVREEMLAKRRKLSRFGISPQSLINIKPVTAAVKELLRFFPAVSVHGSEQPSW